MAYRTSSAVCPTLSVCQLSRILLGWQARVLEGSNARELNIYI